MFFVVLFLEFTGNAQTVTYNTSGANTWTCPTGVTSVTVECWGAGGCGGTRTTNGQTGGGGGGAYASGVITVVPGTVYNLTVGAGGTAGGTNNGGNTSFNTVSVVAAGGVGVASNATAGGAGGLASGSTGTTKFNGGTGGTSGGGTSGGGGGGAGSTNAGGNATIGTAGNGTTDNINGNGAVGVTGNNGGNPGNSYGGGGSGASRTGGSKTGGSGADGAVVLTYCPPPAITTQPTSFTTTTGNANFAVTATGTSLIYQWQRAVSGSGTFVNITSAGLDVGVTYSNYTTATLNLTGATSAVNNYNYQCVVSSSCNSSSVTSSVAVLTYSTCPSIIAEPVSQTVVYSGTSTYFHVNVSSLSGTTYQWERSADGGSTWANITSSSMDAGVSYSAYTTATLYLSTITPSVNGYKYKCVVTSSGCSATTDGTATLIFSGNQLCGSQYRRPITISNTMVGGGVDLTNFPVLINVTDATNLKYPGGHVANANGYDIIFTDATGTPLNFQTESYTAASGIYIGWVKIPTLSASTTTTIYMYYGDGTISTDQSLATTWDTNFVAVYHLSDYTDGTVDALNGNANSTSITAAKVANGVNGFSYIDAAGGASSVYNNVTQNITVSGWVNFATKSIDQKIAGSEDNANGGWKMGIYSDNTLEFECRTSANAPFLNRGYGTPTTLSKNTWYYVAGQYSQGAGGYINTYVGGTANFTSGINDRGSSYATASVMGVSTGTLSLGCEAFAPATANWSGTLDEIRISKVIRSVGWLQTEYNNQNSPGTYVTLGAESGTKSWTGTANWSTTADWSGASLPASGADIIISSGTVTVNSNITVGSIIVKLGAGVTISSGFTLSVSSYAMVCGTINGAGTLAMNSSTSSNQNVSGTGTYSLTNLVINNTSIATPSVTLQAPVSVSGTLTLTKGLLNTDATNIITMQNGSTAPALTSASTSYINGPMRYQLASTTGTTLNFPIGASTDCRPMALSLLHSTASLYNYTAQLFNGNPWTAMGSTLSSQMPSSVDTISGIHYWTINRTDNSSASQPTLDLSGNQTIQLYFGTDDQVFQGSSLTIVKNTAATPSSWIDIGGTSSLGNFSSAQTGSVSSTSSPSAFNSFSTFSLGSKNSGWNPLPIELLSFSAVPNGDKVDVKWETVTETNNAYFTIEKSKDGISFTKLIDVPGAGNSTSYKDYAETDYQPYTGTSYYRLKQTDNNGAYKYFNMVPVTFVSDGQQSIVLFPNPIIQNTSSLSVSVTGYKDQEVVVVLRDIQGKEFLSKVLLSEDDNHVFTVEGTTLLPIGAYIITASSNNKIYNYKIIVK